VPPAIRQRNDGRPAVSSLPLVDEQQALEAALARFPRRADLWRRLCHVTLRQRAPVSEAMLERAFPDHPGIGAMHAFLAPCCAEAVATLDGAHLEPVLAWLHRRFPDCPVVLYFDADWLFQTERIEAAHAVLATRPDLLVQHDFLARRFATVLWNLGRRDEAHSFYERFFRDYTGDLWREPDFAERQHAAIRRGLPPVLISTLPKSGSLFILNTLREGLDAPHCALSYIGLFEDLIPRRVDDFRRGGAVAVEHIFPTPRDINLLRQAELRRLVFHTRDVRQVALSFVHHALSDEIDRIPRAEQLRRRAEAHARRDVFERMYLDELAGWLAFLDQWAAFLGTDHGFEIKRTGFDDLTDDEDAFFRDILDFFGVPASQFDWSVLMRSKQERAGHFRKGERDEWREVLSSRTQERAAELIAGYPRVARSLR
jgi:hypothetical protein